MLRLQWLAADFIMERRLDWLGNLGHMSDDRLPKQLLNRELKRTQPFQKIGVMGCCLLSNLKAI